VRVVVFAYHNMGIASLNALERAGYEIAFIVSHDDDPGENCWFDSVKEWGKERGIPVECPADIGSQKWEERIAALHPEMIFSFYYRHMIREEILRIPPLGAYNLHGSLLPAYRGRCPVNWVLINGETQTGVTLHHMVKKADAGDIVGQRVVPITPNDTALTLYGKLCDAAGILLDKFLPLMKIGCAPRIPQNISLGSYYGGRRPEDGRIDWKWPAVRIYNLIRAVTEPYPGAFCRLADGSQLMIWWATPEEGRAGEETKLPGCIEIKRDGVRVRTGRGRLKLVDVQVRGERLTGDELIRYFKDKEGKMLL
jgi:UDP-4-amino-4-deoxy-L-arabinose formyltransferase/UDP-glucuronic acid dehydrogenase (UDP-4-keto-hexauronic acid decarboxylating)